MDRRLRRKLMGRLLADARVIASHFGLEYRTVEAERSNVTSRYGICYDDGTIKIRLAHAVSGQPLKYSSIVNTLCHELAHLKHFDHGPKFRALYAELLAWARQRGIYRPGRSQSDTSQASPQLNLAEAIRSGQLPTLRESLAGVLAARPTESADVEEIGGPVPERPTREAPSQLELFP